MRKTEETPIRNRSTLRDLGLIDEKVKDLCTRSRFVSTGRLRIKDVTFFTYLHGPKYLYSI